MNRFASLIFAVFCSLALTVPALAGVVINSPANGSWLPSSFRLDAYSSSCGSQPVDAMGYSFDDSSNTTIVKSSSIYQYISSATGSHVVHVKSWGTNGSSCVTDLDIKVYSGSTSTSSSSSSVSIPSGASSVSNIQVLNWSWTHDSGGSGSASGSSSLVSSPSLYGTTRETLTNFTNNGDERYSVTFSDNTSAKNFVWDGWVYLTSSSSMLANLELDVNQTLPSGATMFAGVQCDGWTGHWSYTSNTGSVSSPRMKWIQANNTSCNPQKWSQYKWHHVQFSLSRDNSGYVTYHSVWLDGVQIPLNATVPTAADDGWGPAINTQFQIDGYGSSGHVTAYLDSLKISMW